MTRLPGLLAAIAMLSLSSVSANAQRAVERVTTNGLPCSLDALRIAYTDTLGSKAFLDDITKIKADTAGNWSHAIRHAAYKGIVCDPKESVTKRVFALDFLMESAAVSRVLESGTGAVVKWTNDISKSTGAAVLETTFTENGALCRIFEVPSVHPAGSDKLMTAKQKYCRRGANWFEVEGTAQ